MQRTQILIYWQTAESPCKEACRQCVYLTSSYHIRKTAGIYRGSRTDHHRHQNQSTWLYLAALTNSQIRSSVLSDSSLILTSLVATPAFVHGHDERKTQVISLRWLSWVCQPSSLPKNRQSAGALPASASQPSRFRPYHLSKYSRGNSRHKFSTLLQM